jgi:hypothetical protein
MALQAITLSVDATWWHSTMTRTAEDISCTYCGTMSGPLVRYEYAPPGADRTFSPPACPLCILPHHLERPRIDEEATLVWLPEISQAAFNTSMREIHTAIQAQGEDVHADAVFRKDSTDLRNLYYTRAVLAERSEAAASRVGTVSPRELGLVLLDLSPAAYARRAELLDGLRLMPLGRFFHDDHDVYPQIIAGWRSGTETSLFRSKRTP